MKRRNTERILKQYFAIFAIYLIISLTFFTAQSLAVLNYNISGEGEVQGYARKGNTLENENDLIRLHVVADSNVSFVTNQGMKPLDICLPNGNGVICDHTFEPDEINTNIKNLSFTLKQLQGTPLIKNGNLYIDGNKPTGTIVGTKTANGINFSYNFREPECQESGIGEIRIEVQGKSIVKTIKSKNCTVIGSAFVEFSNDYEKIITYYAVVTDRVGNEYETDTFNLSGDFRAPSITNEFKILRNDAELTDFSSLAEVTADVVVEIEDSDLLSVRGDLSSLNNNPALNTLYKNTSATCTKTSDSIYECKFVGIKIKPSKANLNINITAIDTDKNMNKVTIPESITLRNSAGGVTYIGPLKSHCTADLVECEMRSGMQLLRMELDATSAYEHSVVNIGVNNDKTYGLCKLDEVWKCTGAYTIPTDAQSVKLFVAESRDDYGNYLRSELERTIRIDNTIPVKVGELSAVNNNNNVNCSVSGDELTLHVRVKDLSSEVKIYVNTSEFTTQDTQKGECVMALGGDWDCTLIVRDFSSTPPVPVTKNIIVEDLAGNQLPIPYTFEVCAISSSGMPNVIFGNPTQNSIPNIDRKTASLLPVKVLIPLTFNVGRSASIMYLTVERCTARDMNNMDVAGSSPYFMPANPINGKTSNLILTIGNSGAMLPEGEMKINCTISARIRSGQTVYLRDERETITVKVNTFDQPMGTLDEATVDIINSEKEQLRSLSSKIETRQGILRALEIICDISDLIVKIDGILQMVKSVVYLILVVFKNVPVIGKIANAAWPIINTATSVLDAIVQKFIWPTGFDKGSGVGYIWKYTCIIYTCKFYTLSGLVAIASDAVSGVKAVQSLTIDKDASAEATKKATEELQKKNSADNNPNNNNDVAEVAVYKDGSKMTDVQRKDGKIVGGTRTYYGKDGKTPTRVVKMEPGRDGGKSKSVTTIIPNTPSGEQSAAIPDMPTESKDYDGYKETTINYDKNGKIVGGTETTYNYVDKATMTQKFDAEGKPSGEPQYDRSGYYARTTVNWNVDSDGNKKYTGATSYVNNVLDTGGVMGYKTVPNSQPSTPTIVDLSKQTTKIYGINIPFDGGRSVTTTDYGGNPINRVVTDKYGADTTFAKGDIVGEHDATFWDAFNEQPLSTTTTRNTLLYSDIDRQDWIINPYRSQHYDGLCAPATTYNMQKERQIRCMYVSCLEESTATGMPSSVCADVYAVNDCLYLESAQYRLNKNIWESIFTKDLVKQVIMFAMGYVAQYGYNKLCKKYVDSYGAEGNNLEGKAWKSVGCGLYGAGLKWQEIWAMITDPAEVMKQLFKGTTPEDPGTTYDYCRGGEVYAEYADEEGF